LHLYILTFLADFSFVQLDVIAFNFDTNWKN